MTWYDDDDDDDDYWRIIGRRMIMIPNSILRFCVAIPRPLSKTQSTYYNPVTSLLPSIGSVSIAADQESWARHLDAIVILGATTIPTHVLIDHILNQERASNGDMERNENAAVHAATNCDTLGKTSV
jgi:hypothetical protein